MNPESCSDRVYFSIPVDDDLRRRFDDYITAHRLNHGLIASRLFDGALRQFLDVHAPIRYPYTAQEK